MELYNTASKKLEKIVSMSAGKISFYSCGPTVYDKPTIGNWASFIRYDILARALRAANYDVDWVMNITDVGHLVSDGDEGEDKLEKGARREAKTAWEIAEHYTNYFLEGLDYFNISIPRKNILRATDYIDQQIELIKKLESKGHTYVIDDGVYFDSTTFAHYGKMAHLDIKGLMSGARVNIGAKKNPTDFALWKFSPAGKKRDMEWDSPWGKGFPGWHLECSAIVLDALGDTIDIHAGGIEHIPVHHTNEIAQSESATGKKFVNTWIHNNHLKIDGNKISKSLNNGFTIEDLNKKDFNGLDLRMFVLQSNFRSESNFTWDLLKEASLKRLELQAIADLRYQVPEQISSPHENLDDIKNELNEAFNDNLNTSLVVSTVLPKLVTANTNGLAYGKQAFSEFLKWLDELLGLELLNSQDISDKQKQLIALRDEHRAKQNWDEADKARLELAKQNIELKDTPAGSIWSRTC